MVYYMMGEDIIAVLTDFKLAIYPDETVNRILGSSPGTAATYRTNTESPESTDLNSRSNDVLRCRIGTKSFMSIEILGLTSRGYKHHLSHDLEAL